MDAWTRLFKLILSETLKYLILIGQLAKDLFIAWSLDVIHFICLRKKCVKGQVVVITGGAGGIGKAVGKYMAKLGATIILIDVNEKAVRNAAKEIEKEGIKVKSYCCDCTKVKELKILAERIKNDDDLGPIDILVCCTGYMCAKAILDLDPEGVTKSFDINVISYFWAIQAFLPHMLERNRGHVAAISSIAGHFGQSYSSAYSASKFAIRGLMESLKWELSDLKKTNIKTTTIYPYFTQTPLLSELSPSSRFFGNLSIDYTASNIVDHILYEREEAFIPSIMSIFCLLIKNTSPDRVKSVWRKFFAVVYYTHGYPANNGTTKKNSTSTKFGSNDEFIKNQEQLLKIGKQNGNLSEVKQTRTLR